MSKPTSTTYRILKRARDIIQDGWCQGVAWEEQPDGSMRYCATGALQQAACAEVGNDDRWLDEFATAQVTLLEASLKPCLSINEWNDDPARTKHDVELAFDAVIERFAYEDGN